MDVSPAPAPLVLVLLPPPLTSSASALLPLKVEYSRADEATSTRIIHRALDLGVEIAPAVLAYARDTLEKHSGWENQGLLLNAPRRDVIRFMPALNVTREEIDRMLDGLRLAIEAVRCALDFGFGTIGLERIEADVDPRNLASCRLAERVGFQREGLLRDRWRVGGEFADSILYGLLRGEYRRAA